MRISEEAKDRFALIGVVLAVGAIVAMLTLGWFTLRDVAAGQVRHAATLNAIRTTQRIDRGNVQKLDTLVFEVAAEVAGLKSGNATVSQILTEAGQAVQSLEATQAAICVAVQCSASP